MKGRLVLVLGGTRSGKSSFALKMAEEMPGEHLYVATAEARDDEMKARIEQHRKERGPGWRTSEEPLDVAGVLDVTPDGTVVLLDCLTLWLSNVLGREDETGQGGGEYIREQICRIKDATSQRGFKIVMVSNEVGMGIVPDNPLARRFRDMAGEMHQTITPLADEVWFVVAGIPQRLKG